MRIFLLVGLCVHISLPAAERISFSEIRSAALGRALPVAVVAPAGTAGAGPESPVLFLLHGRGRNHRTLLDSPATRAALLDAGFYIVLPQGEDGWYVDSPARPADRYGRYLNEVLAWAAGDLPVARHAGGRAIAGWSMGGFGAVRFAQTHPGEFGFVASIIGLLDFPRPATLPEGQNYRVPTERFTDDPAVWRQLNPLAAVATLRGTRLTLVLATRGFERRMNENFVAALAAEGMPARVHWIEGAHEFSVVEQAVPLVLAAATDFFHRK
jgi:S-formylglutathione hydrolase FrmB